MPKSPSFARNGLQQFCASRLIWRSGNRPAEWLPEGEDDDGDEDEGARRRRAALPRPERYDEVVESFQEVVSNFSSLSQVISMDSEPIRRG